MAKKEKNKYLELIILFIIIISVAFICLLANSYLESTNDISKSDDIKNFSLNKIYQYNNVLNDIKNYNIPYKRYIDTRNSSYKVYIKSTDNIITGITEIITINYFDPNTYSQEEMDIINSSAINFTDNIEYNIENNNENNNEENTNDNSEEDANELPTEDNEEIPDTEEIPEENNNEMNIITDEVETTPNYPDNWLDIYNYPFEEFNNSSLTNFCNSYNEIESNYSLTCNKSKYSLSIKNNYSISNTNSYIFNTKNYEVILPVKRGTKLTDYLKELSEKGISYKQVDKIE